MVGETYSITLRRWKMDLAALILSILALVVSIVMLPTMFFLRWAKPEITAEFESSQDESGSHLLVILRNKPVENKFQKWMGVTRGKATLRGQFVIKDPGGRYLENGQQKLRLNHGAHDVVIGLEEFQWAVLPAVHHQHGKLHFCSGSEEHLESNKFSSGRYLYQVNLSATGGDKMFMREFIFEDGHLKWGAATKHGRN